MYKNLSAQALGISVEGNELIELALSHGFKGVELDIVAFAQQVATHGLPHARRLLDSSRLRLGEFALPVDWQSDEAAFQASLTQLPEYAKLAAEMKCLVATTVVEPGSDISPYHQNFEQSRQRLSQICQTLQAHGVRLAVGFEAAQDVRAGRAFEFIRDADALWMLLSMVGAANLGLLVDAWQLQASGASLADVLKKVKIDKVFAVRASDTPLSEAGAEAPAGQWASTSRRLPSVEGGAVDTVAVLVALAEAGYSGSITPVAHSSHTAARSRDAVVKEAGQQLDLVWKAAGLTPAGKLQAVRQ